MTNKLPPEQEFQIDPVEALERLLEIVKRHKFKKPITTRNKWATDFPHAVIVHRAAQVQQHEEYESAKNGDMLAALHLISKVITPEIVKILLNELGQYQIDVVVAVHAEEKSGRNKIPLAYATFLAELLNAKIDIDIVQAEKVNRGGSDGLGRLVRPVPFCGYVEKGKNYLIVDDTLTQGGTLASLKGYIEHYGGKVVCMTTLMGKMYSSQVAPSAEVVQNLREFAGQSFEEWWKNEFNYNFDCFTQSEANYLATIIRKSGVDRTRDKIFAARQARCSQDE